MTFPLSIPKLPPRIALWPVNLLAVYNTLSEIYQHALRAWDQEDADPLRLSYHLSSLNGDAKQLLLAIEEDPIGSELIEWLLQSAELITWLCHDHNCTYPYLPYPDLSTPIPSHQNHPQAPNATPKPSGSILSQLVS